jgi:hypothetical protein
MQTADPGQADDGGGRVQAALHRTAARGVVRPKEPRPRAPQPRGERRDEAEAGGGGSEPSANAREDTPPPPGDGPARRAEHAALN